MVTSWMLGCADFGKSFKFMQQVFKIKVQEETSVVQIIKRTPAEYVYRTSGNLLDESQKDFFKRKIPEGTEGWSLYVFLRNPRKKFCGSHRKRTGGISENIIEEFPLKILKNWRNFWRNLGRNLGQSQK